MNDGHAEVPTGFTEPLLRLVIRHAADRELFSYIGEFPKNVDSAAWILKSALGTSKELTSLNTMTAEGLAAESPGSHVNFLKRHQQALMEMFLCRIVDNFQGYIIDLIRLALNTDPRMLHSKEETVPLSDLLNASSLADVIHGVIEAKVSKLSYKSFASLKVWANSRGIPINVFKDLDSMVEDVIATRNIIVHNRGAVNEIYKSLVPSSPLEIGQVRSLSEEELKSMMKILVETCKKTDSLAIQKFALPVIPNEESVLIEAMSKYHPNPESFRNE
jgi:hypothetical protein